MFKYRIIYHSWSRTLKKTKNKKKNKVLEFKFGLTVTIQNRKTSGGTLGYRLYISSKSRDKLLSLVKSYFIPSMNYKLGL